MTRTTGDAVAHEDQIDAELRDLRELACLAIAAYLTGGEGWQVHALRLGERVAAVDDTTARELLVRACTGYASERAGNILG